MPVPQKFDSSLPIDPVPSRFSDDLPIDAGTPRSTPGAVLRPLTEREQLETTFPVGARGETPYENVHNALRDAFTGAYGVLAHPKRTVGSILRSVTPVPVEKAVFGDVTPNPVQSTYEGLNTRPGEAIATGVGQAAATAGLGKVAEGASRVVPEATGRLARILTKTTPKETVELVRETQEANVSIRKSNADAARAHLDETLDALHKTRGNELEYQQALKTAQDAAQEAQRALDKEHEEVVQKALQETREKEDLYQQELRKAKQESEDAYQKKLAEVEKKRADAERYRRQELHKYFAKKAKVQSDFAEAQEKFNSESSKQAKIEPTNAKLKTAWSNLRAGVETAREKALEVGNEKYSGVNEALSGIQSDPEMFPDAVAKASESLRGSKTEPTLLKAMEKTIEEGIVPSYADLQGDYSSLCKELSKGNLPGDVFHAYDQLHEAIGDELQRIADSKGQGAALKDARNYWRRMKQTFGQPLSEGDVATKALKTSAPDIASAEEQANRIRLLGSFDPRLPGLFEHIQNLQKGAESLPKPVPEQTRLKSLAEARKPLPSPPPRPEVIPNPEPVPPKEVQPSARAEIPNRPEQVQLKLPKLPERVAPPDRPLETPEKTTGSGDIRGKKLSSLQRRIGKIRSRGEWIATGAAGYRLISNILSGNLAAVPADLFEGGVAIGGIEGIARLLENPTVVEMLTRPRPEDIAQIPPELRGDMATIAQIAARKGIKVDPRLYAAGATQPRRRVADLLAGR